MADYTPVYSGGVQPWTATTSGAVVGGNVLVVSGNGTVGVAGADSALVCGVAANDTASGGRVTVWPIEGCIHELVASGAIAALAVVSSDAAGQVHTAVAGGAMTAGTNSAVIGVALTTAAGSPLKLRVQGRRS